MCSKRDPAGFTLIELLVLIVVFVMALSGVLYIINVSVSRSADPLLRKQAFAVAESMMEEVMLMPFIAGPGNGARQNFDDVFDYNDFNTTGITTIQNTAIPALSGYNLNVTVVNAAVGGVGAANAVLITVTVTDPRGTAHVLSGYKTNY